MGRKSWRHHKLQAFAEIKLLWHWTKVFFRFFGWRRRTWTLLALFIIGGYFLIDAAEKHQKYTEVYDQLYPYYYKEYLKTVSEYRAKHYAAFYAGYYAKYYSSRQYQQSLKFALPPPTEQAFQYPKESPNASLALDDYGIRMLKYFEGFRPEAYIDIGGKLTIGYGHLVREGEVFATLSRSNGEKLLRQDVKLAEAVVKRNVKVGLTQHQFSALVSLVYNIGSGNFSDSKLLDYINREHFGDAANEFLRWDRVGVRRAPALSKRRQFERQLFLS
jgi:lysozyme